MKIKIIGSGFAGLSSALYLSRNPSNSITVYDKFNCVQSVGAGILIQPSSMEVLRKLNLYDDMLKRGEKIYNLVGINHRDKQVFLTSYNDYATQCFGVGIHRSTLFQLLYDQCKTKVNIKFELEREITSLEDQSLFSDLLIVANGSHSCLREQVPIKQSYRLYPYGCLWTTIEQEYTVPNTLYQYLKYSREMMGMLPSGVDDHGKRIISVFWSLPVTSRNKYTKEEILKEMKFHLRHQKPELIEKLSQANYSFAVYADVYMKKYDHRNIVFIGDAAHGMSPQLGQGANMALLDSYFLSKVLAESDNNVELALPKYTSIRSHHIKFYAQASKLLTPLYQSDLQLYGRFRDLLFSIAKYMQFSRNISSQILCGKKTSWIRNKEIKY
ncbi:unnamed protein product [Rotaria magnacalcarata]